MGLRPLATASTRWRVESRAELFLSLDFVYVPTEDVDDIVLGESLYGGGDIARYVAAQRWSGGRGGGVTDIEFVDAATVIATECTVVFTVIRTQLDDHREIRYALPIGLRALGDPLAERAPAFLIGEVHTEQRDAFAYDAVGDPEYVTVGVVGNAGWHNGGDRLRDAAIRGLAARRLPGRC